MALSARPFISSNLLDPRGRSLHKWVQHSGCTVDIVRSPGTSTPHHHVGLEFVVVHSGMAIWSVGDWVSVLLPGDVLLFDATVPHSCRPVLGTYVRSTVHLMPDLIENEVVRTTRETGLPHVRSLSDPSLNRLFEAVCDLRTLQRPDRLEDARRVVTDILDTAHQGDDAPSPIHPIVRDVLTHMTYADERYERIDELAAKHYVSEGHLFYLFRKYLGCTPQKIWQTIRVERATHEILKKDLDVQELAHRSGFASRRGFQRAFKRVTGMTVEEFRYRLTSQFWS